jgi:predicted nucleic acid-binding protein
MNIDITEFKKINVIDTCAIDNLLSSATLYRAARSSNCSFCYTKFVEYEMLYKSRKNLNEKSKKLQQKLKDETNAKRFECHNLSIDDLQEIEILEQRKRLGGGELSSIAFAKKINQNFMTDDSKARKLGISVLGNKRVQTTPHLVGWLFYNRELIDSDFPVIISEHQEYNRPLSQYFEEAYHESLRIRNMNK